MDKFQAAWQNQDIEPAPREGGREVIASVERRLEQLHRTIARRNRLEVITALIALVLFGAVALLWHARWPRIGSALVVAGLLLIIVKLRDKVRNSATERADVNVREFCAAEMKKLDAQIRLLQSVVWWYLALPITGAIVFFVGVVGLTGVSAAYAAVCLAVAAYTAWINRKAAARTLTPLRSELARILADLER